MAVFELTAPKIETTIGNPAQYAQAATDAWRGVSQSITAAQDSFRAAGDILDANGEKARQIRAQQMLEEKFQWDKAERERKVLGQKAEDIFAKEIAAGAPIEAGLVGRGMEEKLDKIALSDDELKATLTPGAEFELDDKGKKTGHVSKGRYLTADEIQAKSTDTSMPSAERDLLKSALAKTRTQEEISALVDSSPESWKLTDPERFQYASRNLRDENGNVLTPTQEILKEVNSVNAAELKRQGTYDKAHNKADQLKLLKADSDKYGLMRAEAEDTHKRESNTILTTTNKNLKDNSNKGTEALNKELANSGGWWLTASDVESARVMVEDELTKAGVTPTPDKVANVLVSLRTAGTGMIDSISDDPAKAEAFIRTFAGNVKESKNGKLTVADVPSTKLEYAKAREQQALDAYNLLANQTKELSPAQLREQSMQKDLRAILAKYKPVQSEQQRKEVPAKGALELPNSKPAELARPVKESVKVNTDSKSGDKKIAEPSVSDTKKVVKVNTGNKLSELDRPVIDSKVAHRNYLTAKRTKSGKYHGKTADEWLDLTSTKQQLGTKYGPLMPLAAAAPALAAGAPTLMAPLVRAVNTRAGTLTQAENMALKKAFNKTPKPNVGNSEAFVNGTDKLNKVLKSTDKTIDKSLTRAFKDKETMASFNRLNNIRAKNGQAPISRFEFMRLPK